MTNIRNSQFANVTVAGGVGNIRASQLVTVSAMAPPFAAGLRSSQIAIVTVIANGKNFLPLGPVFKLPCWQPCASYGTRQTVIIYG